MKRQKNFLKIFSFLVILSMSFLSCEKEYCIICKDRIGTKPDKTVCSEWEEDIVAAETVAESQGWSCERI